MSKKERDMSREEALAVLTKEELWQRAYMYEQEARDLKSTLALVEVYRERALEFHSELRGQKDKVRKLKEMVNEMSKLIGGVR